MEKDEFCIEENVIFRWSWILRWSLSRNFTQKGSMEQKSERVTHNFNCKLRDSLVTQLIFNFVNLYTVTVILVSKTTKLW